MQVFNDLNILDNSMTYIITYMILLLLKFLKWGVTTLWVKTVLRYSNFNMNN